MATDHYPTVEDLDQALIALMGATPEERRPAGMPPAPVDAARWLRTCVLEAPSREEAPRRTTRRDGTEAWRWPYLDRCLVLARKFLRLPAAEQGTIVAARQDGIPWRGDDLETFMRIVAEHERMREVGVEAYRREALTKLRGLRVGDPPKSTGAEVAP